MTKNEYNCDLCENKYKTKNGLSRHKLNFHKVEINDDLQKQFICDICGKKYNNKFSKYKHKLKCKEKEKINNVELEKIKNEFNQEIQELKNILKYKEDQINNIKTTNENKETKCKNKNTLNKNDLDKIDNFEELYNLCNELLDENKKLKITKSIPSKLRQLIWKKEFGDNKEGICPIFNCNNKINKGSFGFHAGHIISKHNGGETSFDNLRP